MNHAGPMAQLSRQQKFIGNHNGGVPSIHPVRVTYSRDVNTESSTVLRWGFLLLALLLLPLDLVQSKEPDGFLSIDCGSRERYQDETTGLEWETDDNYLAKDLIDKGAMRVNNSTKVSLGDNAKQLRTAMVFIPGSTHTRTKFCYTYNIRKSHVDSFSFLIRAVFPCSKLIADVSGQAHYSTRFYFTVDSAFITTIALNSSEATTVELIVTPLDEKIYICLVPLEDRSSIAAISSLEVRPLRSTLYKRAKDVPTNASSGAIATKQTSYLMLIERSNFGGSASVRYPNDIYDRIWRSPDVPETSRSDVIPTKSKSGTIKLEENINSFEVPLPVLNTAWTGTSQSAEIPLKFNISKARAARSMSSFLINMCFLDVEQEVRESGLNRTVGVELIITEELHFTSTTYSWVSSSEFPNVWYNYQQTFPGAGLAEFRILPGDSSTLPAMVNAVELYSEFEVISARTSKSDVDAIEKYSTSGINKSSLDTAGDPCLPVPWEWLVCSIEVPPRITQINVTSKGLETELQEDLGLLNSLTILDLSYNRFTGTLPESIMDLTALRLLNLNDNHISGRFPEGSLKNLESLSLSTNNFNGTLTSLIGALDDQMLSLDLSYNQFSGDLPEEIGKFRNLQILDLSHNLFSGELKFSISKLKALKSLKLNHNNLNGTVPGGIFDRNSTSPDLEVDLSDNRFEVLNLTTWFTATQELDNREYNIQQKVRLVNNYISEVILPQYADYADGGEFLEQRSQELDNGTEPTSFILLRGNPWCKNVNQTTVTRYLCRSNEYSYWPQTDNNKGVNKKMIIIISVVSAISLLVMATIVGHFVRKVRIRARKLHEIQEALAKQDVRPPWFDYKDLKAATGDFSTENELGRGGFGSVYRAVQSDGSIFAVKRLFPTEQNVTDFLKEMVLISGIKHRHLIQLKGCSVGEKEERMLVYEFAENKDLAEALWGEQRSSVLDWSKRFNICLAVARGLSYLHEELQPKIIHRDIKSQNILLDKDYNAKIADFGLARPAAETDVTQLTLNIGGTKGYLSPEYATDGILTEKLDVYSYGILVLEIVSGRQCIDLNKPPDQQYLRIWAKYLQEEDKLLNLLQEDLQGTCPSRQVLLVLETALQCLQPDPKSRPSMSQVVSMLMGGTEVASEILCQLQKATRSPLIDRMEMYKTLFEDTIGDRTTACGDENEERALIPSGSTNSSAIQLVHLSAVRPR